MSTTVVALPEWAVPGAEAIITSQSSDRAVKITRVTKTSVFVRADHWPAELPDSRFVPSKYSPGSLEEYGSRRSYRALYLIDANGEQAENRRRQAEREMIKHDAREAAHLFYQSTSVEKAERAIEFLTKYLETQKEN